MNEKDDYGRIPNDYIQSRLTAEVDTPVLTIADVGMLALAIQSFNLR